MGLASLAGSPSFIFTLQTTIYCYEHMIFFTSYSIDKELMIYYCFHYILCSKLQ